MESEGKLKLVEKLKGMQAQLQVRLTAVRELKPILRKVKFEEEIKAAQKKLAELADLALSTLDARRLAVPSLVPESLKTIANDLRCLAGACGGSR